MNRKLLECKGIIRFSPENVTKKHHTQKEWKRVALVETNDDLCEYYKWFLEKRFDLKLNKPLRNSHVTFINDRDSEIPQFDVIEKIFNNTSVNFYIDILPKTNTKHWWLRVFSEELCNIREMGGAPRTPYFGLHLTLGLVKEKDIEYNKYILRTIQRFNLIHFEERKDLKEYSLVNLP